MIFFLMSRNINYNKWHLPNIIPALWHLDIYHCAWISTIYKLSKLLFPTYIATPNVCYPHFISHDVVYRKGKSPHQNALSRVIIRDQRILLQKITVWDIFNDDETVITVAILAYSPSHDRAYVQIKGFKLPFMLQDASFARCTGMLSTSVKFSCNRDERKWQCVLPQSK